MAIIKAGNKLYVPNNVNEYNFEGFDFNIDVKFFDIDVDFFLIKKCFIMTKEMNHIYIYFNKNKKIIMRYYFFF